MAKRSILEIENALLAKLDPLVTSHEVLVGTYNGDLDPDRFEAAVQSWPAVLVYYAGSSVQDQGTRRAEYLEFMLFVCDRHEREQAEARRGGLTNPGSCPLLDAVADLLEGKRVIMDDDVFPCDRVAQQSEIQGNAMSVYSARYVIQVNYLVNQE